MPENQTDIKRYLDLKEGEKKSLIDPQELKELDQVIKASAEQHKETSNKIKEQVLQYTNMHAIIGWIRDFGKSEQGIKLLTDTGKLENKATIDAYVKLLQFFEQSFPNDLKSLNQNIPELNMTMETLKKMATSNQRPFLEAQKVFEKEINHQKHQKSIQQILGAEFKNFTILKSYEDIKNIFTTFLDQYNNYADTPLTIENFSTEILKASPAQKERFATYLASVLSSSGGDEKQGQLNLLGRWEGLKGKEGTLKIRKYIFWKLFPDGNIPTLKDWNGVIVGDKSHSTWLYQWHKLPDDPRAVQTGGYEYPREKSNISKKRIQREKGEEALNLAFLANGVDDFWVKININLWKNKQGEEIIIQGQTRGNWEKRGDKWTQKEKSSQANIIDFQKQLPKGIVLQNWELIIDQKLFEKSWPIEIQIESQGNEAKNQSSWKDETMVSIFSSTPLLDKKPEFWHAKGNYELFNEGGYEPNKDFSEAIKSIQKVLQERIADGGKFEINIGAETSDTRVTEHLQQKLATDLPKLQKTLTDTIHAKFKNPQEAMNYLTNIQAQILAPTLLKDNFNGDQANYMLALARLYGMINTFIQDLSAEDIKKVQFNVTSFKKNISQEEGTRKSFFDPKKI